MFLSTIGKSKSASKAFIKMLAATLPLLGYKVRPDTIKRRRRNPDGTYVRNPNGTCVYDVVGFCEHRFFAVPKRGFKPALILTARKQVSRPIADIEGDTYLSRHRGYLTIAIETSRGRFLWDIQNRDVAAK